MLELDSSLIKLAELFKSNGYTLYIVGGYVRDKLLGVENKDIDITSNMPYEDVIKLCTKNKIKATPINKTLGTLQIKTKDGNYEYTQFRKESYNKIGVHSPSEVEFIDDIKVDMLRRDITINSMYLDILNSNIIDMCGGQKDLTNKVIRTSNNPNITLRDDALRILRIIRFASLYNFKIFNKTFKYLKIFAGNLRAISKERILGELKSIVVSDLKFNYPNKIFLTLFNKLKLYPCIFNSTLTRCKKIKKKDIDKYYTLSKDARLVGFYFLILKNFINEYLKVNQLQFISNSILGQDGIKESKDNISITNKLFLIYQNLEYGVDFINATINYLTLSNCEREIIDAFTENKTKDILSANIKTIKDNNLPISVHELPITASDLIDKGIERKYIGTLLNTLFNQVLEMKVKNEKEDLINLALEIHKTFSENNIEGVIK